MAPDDIKAKEAAALCAARRQAIAEAARSPHRHVRLDQRHAGCLSLSPPYILIALLPIAVFLSLEIFVGIFAQAPNGLPSPSNEVPLQWMEEAARLQFLGLFILFVWFSVDDFIKTNATTKSNIGDTTNAHERQKNFLSPDEVGKLLET